MTVEQGLRAELHDRPKVLARALRAAREQGTIGDKFWGFDEDSVFNWGKTKERWLYWNAVADESPNPDQYLPEGYVDVEDEEPKDASPWISVKKQKPQHKDKVLVICEHGVTMAQYTEFDNGNELWWAIVYIGTYEDSKKAEKVTHWMPLDKLPKP